jgi:hypothetical protein
LVYNIGKVMSNLKSEESGLISIAVTLIVMSILTLMAIGFSNLASREYRQAVDQQLSTQAFYSSESGINQALHEGTSFTESCDNTTDGGQNVAFTCVKVNLEPSTLEYSDVGQDSSIIVPIKANSPITRVRISWQAKDGSVDFPNNCEARLQSLSDWGSKTPVLNAMLIPAKDFSTRDELANKTQKLILYPTSAACGGAGNYPAVNGNVDTKGSHVNASCNSSNTPKYCFVDINNTNGLVSGNADFILRLKSIYGSSAVSITAFNGADQVPFVGAQKEIDSTGRAGDVLRRVKVNVPIASQSAIFPEFAVEVTKGLCKRMTVGTTVLANPSTGVCAIPLTTDQATGGGTGGGTLQGNASITTLDDPTTGNWSTSIPYYDFSDRVVNDSAITPGTLQSCTWSFDDGTVLNLAASDSRCQPGVNFNHAFPDVSGLINRTKGSQGCYIYGVRLTNTFTPSSGIPPATEVRSIRIPIGTANDIPNPITGVGICYGKYRNAPNPPIYPDTSPTTIPSPYTNFPVPYPTP